MRPIHPKPDIVITRKGKAITVRNLGNTTALLTLGKQCVQDTCQPLPMAMQIRRLYAGNVWHFTVPKAAPVVFTQRYMHQVSTVRSQ